jgi:hypothetical protein
MKIIAGSRSVAGAAFAGAFLAASLAAGCGNAGGDAPKAPEAANLYVKSFSAPNYTGLFLDEDLQFVFSAPVSEESINPDSIQIRTGPTGGIAPFGQYVRGVFLVDPDTGNRVVIDPDPNRITENQINRIESTGDLSRLEDSLRIDLGYDQPKESTGERRPLFDKSRSNIVTFVPDIPTRASKKVLPSGSTQVTIDDAAYTPGSTYTVAVPGQPSSNVLENLSGDPLISINNRVFTSSFRVIPDTLGTDLFLGSESAGIPRIIHTAPFNGDTAVPVTTTIAIRFSQGLDPRTVLDPDNPQFLVEWVTNAKKSITVPAANVSAGTDTVTSAAHGFVDGDRIQLTATTNTYPAGLPATLVTNHSVPASAVTVDDINDLDPNENSILLAGHGFIGGDIVKFTSTSGSMPLGLLINTNYYVVGTSFDRFRLSLTKGGSVVPIFTPGTGTHNFQRTTPIDYYVVNAATDTFQLSLTPGGGVVDILSSGIGNHTFTGTKPTSFPIPCTVFLAQQRLGKCEVILTPIAPLPSTANPDDPTKSSSSIRVTASALILDLVGNAMVPSTFSFFTGPSSEPFPGDIFVDFIDPETVNSTSVPQSFFENEAETSAVWNADKPYVGAVAGEATAAFAPYAGDASETSTSIGAPSSLPAGTLDDLGNFYAQAALGDVTLHTGTATQRIFNFQTFRIGIGSKVFVTGNHPLVIHCQGDVNIEGELILDGSTGANGIAGTQPAGPVTGGAGGAGGPGGSAGGDGAIHVLGGGVYSFGSFEGQNGFGAGGGLGGFTGENDGNALGTFWPRDPVALAAYQTRIVPTANVNTTTNKFASSNHQLDDGGRIRLTATSGAPAPLAINTDYWIVGKTANDFQLALTRGGAAIDVTSQGTGPHTFTVFSQSPCLLTAPQTYAPCRNRECGGGGGYFANGGDAANIGKTQMARNGAGYANGGTGGLSWGDDEMSTVSSTSASVEVAGGGTVTLTGIPTLVAGAGGSGGGGGGGEDDSQNSGLSINHGVADGSDEGGAGGGGGGGAVQIVSYTALNVAGKISAKGGKGGDSNDGGAGGGGGSGGAIWLQCRGDVSIQLGAVLDVAGGAGGGGNADGTTDIALGGTGSKGRIRIEDGDGVVVNLPADASLVTFDPVVDPEDPLDTGFIDLASLAVSDWQNTFIFTPDFSAPTIVADVFPTLGETSRVRVYMQGAPENVTNGVDDPDVLNATQWGLVYDSNLCTVVTVPSGSVDAATDTWTAAGHGLVDGTAVTLSNVAPADLPGGVDNQAIYFVVNSTANTFKLSATATGAPIDLTSGGVGTHAVVTSGIDPAGTWDDLDNNKWWRFRVRFDVDAAHQFADPVPTIRSALFQIDQ